jgi:hypothetical protein
VIEFTVALLVFFGKLTVHSLVFRCGDNRRPAPSIDSLRCVASALLPIVFVALHLVLVAIPCKIVAMAVVAPICVPSPWDGYLGALPPNHVEIRGV